MPTQKRILQTYIDYKNIQVLEFKHSKVVKALVLKYHNAFGYLARKHKALLQKPHHDAEI
jgi:hypothetical protein